jgi:DNA-binding MarR family transcriptional regulator
MTVAEGEDDDVIDTIVGHWRTDFPGEDLTATGVAVRLQHLYLYAVTDLQAVLRPFDIGAGEMDLLFCLMNAGSPYRLRPIDLSKGCMVTTGAITGRIDRLEQLGLVNRVQSTGDRRTILVEITDTGMAMVKRLRGLLLHTSEFHKAIRRLPIEEQRTLHRLLKKLNALTDSMPKP